jgi:hypothetical protein
MSERKIGRREVLTAGSAAAIGVGAAATATPAAAQAADPSTPITDSLSEEQASLLTDAATALTEGDAVLLNKSLRNPDEPLPEALASLTTDDVQSLHSAFQGAHENMFELASLSPSMVGMAHAETKACCCCTPASCCCAAAQTVPSRSRQIA